MNFEVELAEGIVQWHDWFLLCLRFGCRIPFSRSKATEFHLRRRVRRSMNACRGGRRLGPEGATRNASYAPRGRASGALTQPTRSYDEYRRARGKPDEGKPRRRLQEEGKERGLVARALGTSTVTSAAPFRLHPPSFRTHHVCSSRCIC